jgi:hypothetical protein
VPAEDRPGKKLKRGRLVPSLRFDLPPGPPSRILRLDAERLKHIRSNIAGIRLVEHPVLASVSLESGGTVEELPLIPAQGVDGSPLWADRTDPSVRWFLPSYRLLPSTDPDTPALIVRRTGIDAAGSPVFAGRLRLSFEKFQDPIVTEAIAAATPEQSITPREVPVTLKEVELRLQFIEEGEGRSRILSAPLRPGAMTAEFELLDNALKLTYALLAEHGGSELVLVGDFDAWALEPTDDGQRGNAVPLPAEVLRRQGALLSSGRLASLASHAGRTGHLGTLLQNRIIPQGGAAPSWQGTWSTSFGELRLVQNGHVVSGDYKDVGRIEGTADQKRRTLEGTFTNQGRRGRLKFVLDGKGKGFQGAWAWGSEKPKAEWKGRRTSTARPSVRAADSGKQTGPVFVKRRLVFENTAAADIPCRTSGHQFQLEEADGGTRRVLGCEPPWDPSFRAGARFREVPVATLSIPERLAREVRVFESLEEVARFLVVPRSYVITRTTDTNVPALSLTSVLDPEDPMRSRVTFDFVVAPDLLESDMARLQVACAEHASRLDGRPPILGFPTVLPTPLELDWVDPFMSAALPIVDGDAVVLTAVANSVAEAAAVVERLRGLDSAPNAALRFALDETATVASAVLLRLDRTTGPALQLEGSAGGGFTEITNTIESPVVVSALVFVDPEGSQVHTVDLPEQKRLEPGESFSFVVPDGEAGRVSAEYEILEEPSLTLTERRVDVGVLEVRIGIDTDLQPDEEHAARVGEPTSRLESVNVELRRESEASDTVTLSVAGGTFDTDALPLLVPLDRYLDPSQRKVDFRASFSFEDGTELQSEWGEHDYGASTNLTIRRQLLETLLPSG